ncbi:hypothetical protein Msp_0955 [Methanosphaera stadtmanae DSM 3091]|uniref:Uncharacterized protein n=1 Tax=Methanosphaera stadtmanae (strain ATCC 43021 / DSM 3091 / JCM 11832 / MCB-3) TaxID=339860 RepID=Q2NFR0_METST|nr:hypothetical protein Msp_0955 [Methanosphaera stadtmanae DSM 3091]
MILFYYETKLLHDLVDVKFQFHYDLILLLFSIILISCSTTFQFHYDLILFTVFVVVPFVIFIFQFHYDLILFFME